MNRFLRSAFFPLIVIVVLVWLASQTLIHTGGTSEKRTTSQAMADVQQGLVASADFNPGKRSISLKYDNGKHATVHYASDQAQFQFQQLLQEKGVTWDSKGTGGFSWTALIGSFLPFLLLIGFWIFLMNQVQGGGSKVMSFGKSRAKRMAPDSPKIGFKDVAGVDEAVEELQEIKEFLENPKKFQALGLTISLPTEDRYLTTRKALLEQIAMTMGGRAAEELVFNEVTTGAANDIEKVTATAKQMVMRFGMSEKLGPRVLGRNHDMPFLGREMGAEPDYSEEVAREIDDEIRRIIEEGHDLATTVLRQHIDDLHRISQILIERETIDRDQFEGLLAGESEDAMFPPEPAPAAEPQGEPERRPQPKPRPFPLPGGAAMQPPEPEAS